VSVSVAVIVSVEVAVFVSVPESDPPARGSFGSGNGIFRGLSGSNERKGLSRLDGSVKGSEKTALCYYY
jgi:hypothetical protein